jgi:hypothetical protein
MKAHISISIAVALCLACSGEPAQEGKTMDKESIKSTILSIQKQIVDLTNPVEPFNCKEFVIIRKSMSRNTAERIVQLIEHGELTTAQSEIGVLLLSGLPENINWQTTSPLVNISTHEDVISALLLPPLPYGPGYANSYTNEAYVQKLRELRGDRRCGTELKRILDLILNGNASSIYSNYLKHPDQYGY